MKVVMLFGALLAVSITPVGGFANPRLTDLSSVSDLKGPLHSSPFSADPTIKKCVPNCPQ
jgi:hypothetical protein